jgi:hypothetical protein
MSRNEKKRFPFASKKQQLLSLLVRSFLVSPKMKKTNFPFGWL